MKLKKLIALGLATVMSASMLVGCGAKSDSNASTDNGDKVFKVGMITDTGGVNDESFKQSTLKGFQDAQEKFGKDKFLHYKKLTNSMKRCKNIMNKSSL